MQGFSTRAIHASQEAEEITGSVNVPIFQTSTYKQEGIGKHKGFEYARTQNPTRFAFEGCMASLEQGTNGFAFGSGLAAIDAVMKLVKPGDRVIAGDDMYGGTFRLFDKVLKPLGYEFVYVDMRDPENVKNAITSNTKMIYAETPTNPMMRLCDLSAIGIVAKDSDCIFVVDNTFMSPYLQNPLLLGASISLHSSTKYIGGHSDVVGGVVVTNDAIISEKLKFIQNACGAIPGPQDCFLALRSLKTLAIRMEKHCENAIKISKHLSLKKEFQNIHYPGLESFPQFELAKKQMKNFGGMISVDLGSFELANKLCSNVKIFTFAESLGGVESLLCHPVSMTHGSVPKETRDKLGITDGLVRFSIGIENVEDLINDIEQAIS
ncbi:MAG: PLP-dependent transferase [Chlorobiota bacterium]|nr:PLP-dependent transferase [Chlorobiota bacterium]QQS65688.1 MAG: PLP-dependent transferase [Chlorobiota bacterium]